MLIKRARGWEIPERETTSESVFLNRRALLAGATGITASIATPSFLEAMTAQAAADATASHYPVKRNDMYPANRKITPEEVNLRYNNFYEFGSSKQIARAAKALKTDPWAIKFDGLVEAEQTIDFADLLKRFHGWSIPAMSDSCLIRNNTRSTWDRKVLASSADPVSKVI